jgi:molybdate transport system regulatory protein
MIGARNVIKGKVKEIKKGAVNGIVKVDVGEGIVISSNCSMESIEQLGLAEGKEVQVVIKAMGVMLANEKLNIGARNQVEGTVCEIKKGTVNCLVKIKTPNGLIFTSNLSLESVEQLGIKEGQTAVAIFKAMNVLLMV